MSSNPVSRAEFESLVAEVRVLTGLIRNLTIGETQPERSPSGGSLGSFEAVSTVASGPAAESTVAVSELSRERIEVAGDIGAWVKRCLAGQLRGLSGRERVQLASRYYLVFRTFDQAVHNPPLVFCSWREAKARVYSTEGQPSDSVFVGLPTKAEARLVVQSAGFSEPSALRRA